MRKFRFIGNPDYYHAPDKEKSAFVVGDIYPYYYIGSGCYHSVSIYATDHPRDWEEILEEPTKPLHKDTDLGHFSLEIMKSFISIAPHLKKDTSETANSDFVANCICLAQELIKQLDAETKQT